MAQITLNTLTDTRRLGAVLAEAINCCGVTAILLRGPLGSGKTTLTNALVMSMPGGDDAEVASPSFTLCNHYPTTPPIVHCDLYRSPDNLPEEIFDALERPAVLTILEWADYLPRIDAPQDYLDILLQPCEKVRRLTLQAHGPNAVAILRYVGKVWPVDAF